MSWRLAALTMWALLLLPLTLSPLLGLLTPYVALLFVIPLFFATIARGQFPAAYRSYPARAFLFVFVLLAVLFALTSDSVSDALRAFNFTMLLAYGAIAWFLTVQTRPDAAQLVATLAGLGVAIGFLEILASVLLGHSVRPTAVNIGPIVLSNGMLALGFVSLGGALIRRDRLAWAFVLAPIVALAATLITGSRGPLIAVPFAMVAAAIFFWRYRFGGSMRAALIGAAGLTAAAAIGAVVVLQGRAGSMLGVFGAIAEGGPVVDETTRLRLVLYKAGWQSFIESPWLGHGWGNIMGSVQPFIAASDLPLIAKLPQLHNDVLNFAVAGGVIGVAAYLLIISAPIVGAKFSSRDKLRPFRLYATTLVTIVYIGGGLTDLMFGFEFHTFLFAMLTAIILGFCRDPAQPAVPSATN
jgi:O-antigen ligase